MEISDPLLTAVLAEFDLQITTCASLGSGGGFSGALLWKLETNRGSFVARRWPASHPSADHLQWIHQVIDHAQARGFYLLPAPLRTRRGTSFSQAGGNLWEIDRWLPGAADFHTNPSNARLHAAMQALAHFHLAVGTMNERARSAPSPGIGERLMRLQSLRSSQLARLEQSLSQSARCDYQALAILGQRWVREFRRVAPAVETVLREASLLRVVQLPCLRDIWHDHVLFDGDAVRGLLDVGAMRIESAAADIARLVGSLWSRGQGEERPFWQTAIASYAAHRELTRTERQLIAAFDASTVAMSGLNWVEWLFCDGRHFADLPAIERRLATGLERLQSWEPNRGLAGGLTG